jgi:hypothetical protein
MEQARQDHGDAGRQAEGFRQQVGLAEREGGNRHIAEEIDDQIEALAAEARQHFDHADAAGERPVDGVDDQRDAEPHEHPFPVAARRGDERKQQTRRPSRRRWTPAAGKRSLMRPP